MNWMLRELYANVLHMSLLMNYIRIQMKTAANLQIRQNFHDSFKYFFFVKRLAICKVNRTSSKLQFHVGPNQRVKSTII